MRISERDATITPLVVELRGLDRAQDVYELVSGEFARRTAAQLQARAERLLAEVEVELHGAASGDIVVRPWGERSFYVQDPWDNGLCFVDQNTLFTGR